jgi:hypothetical protein
MPILHSVLHRKRAGEGGMGYGYFVRKFTDDRLPTDHTFRRALLHFAWSKNLVLPYINVYTKDGENKESVAVDMNPDWK